MGNFGQNARRGPFAKFSILAELCQPRIQLVEFQPNQGLRDLTATLLEVLRSVYFRDIFHKTRMCDVFFIRHEMYESYFRFKCRCCFCLGKMKRTNDYRSFSIVADKFSITCDGRPRKINGLVWFFQFCTEVQGDIRRGLYQGEFKCNIFVALITSNFNVNEETDIAEPS